MSHWENSVGATDEWYTPPEVFAALGCDFDLDVASPENGPMHVPTCEWLFHDALNEIWFGFVWMNPPYGGRNALRPWMKKFFAHSNGIALTPDRTSAPWFQEAWEQADLVLFTKKIRFINQAGERGKMPSNGSALWAIGERGCTALRRASSLGFGILATPEKGYDL